MSITRTGITPTQRVRAIPRPAAPTDRGHVIAIGDSITAACSADLCVDGTPSRSWAQWVAAAIDMELTTFAEPGATVERVHQLLTSRNSRSAIALVHVGTNDVLSTRRWSAPRFRRHIEELFARVDALAERVLVLQLPAALGAVARGLAYGPNLSHRVAHARSIIEDVCSGVGAVLVEPPTWAENQVWLDGVHPTSTGHRAVADAVLPNLGVAEGTRGLTVEEAVLRRDFVSWRRMSLLKFLAVQPMKSWAAWALHRIAEAHRRGSPVYPQPNCTQDLTPEYVRTRALRLVKARPVDAARLLCSWAAANEQEACHVHLVNSYTLFLLERDPALRAVLSGDAVNFADGRPLATAIRVLQKEPDFHQVRGPRLFVDTFDQGRSHGLRHFLLGSTPEVLEALTTSLETKYPGVIIAGTFSPSFGASTPAQETAQDALITAADPDIIWVGLGTPKQNFETARLAASMPAVCVGVGAAFDFVAGTQPEAPTWMITLGLEWCFRLATEPHRLWRRYVYGNLFFLKSLAAGAYSDPARR